MRFWSRRLLSLLVGAILGVQCLPKLVQAQAPPLPVQVGLLDKVAKYDRNLATRGAEEITLLVYRKLGDVTSEKQTDQLLALIRGLRTIAGIKAQVWARNYINAETLGADLDRYVPAVVILSAGLSDQAGDVAEQLAGRNVLSMSTVPADVRAGIVLGFDLVATKPEILINLRQARRQGVEFSASLLRLSTVYR